MAAWHFDGVTVDRARFRVIVNGVPQALEPKTFRLLEFLIEHRDRVVTKEEIFQAVWTGTFVSDNALTRAIAQIRKAIGDDPRQPRYIETVPTIGYRFLAEVTDTAGASPAPSTPPRVRRLGAIAAIAGVALVIVAAALWGWRQHRAPAAAETRAAPFLPVQFSSSAGLDIGASFSPDGTLIAYASDKSGAFQIYVKSFDASARELQLTDDDNQNLYPAFSPDGRWIAFASMRRRGIFRVPAIGGPMQRLTDFGVQPVWSPDSQLIVFRSTASASLSTTDYYWPAESSLWSVPAGGGEPARIGDDSGELAGGQSFPSFTPAGDEIRFVNAFKGKASIWTYRFADRTARKLFESSTFPYSNATFSRDGRRMWFVNWQLNGEIGIWQLALDPARETPLGDPAPLYPSAYAVPRDLVLSADGQRLAFTAVLSNSRVVTQSVTGHPAGTVSLTNETSYRYGLVRTSPDGRQVSYSTFLRNGLTRSVVVNADGSESRIVDSSDAAEFYPTICGDNRLVAVQSAAGSSRLVSRSLADGATQLSSELPPGVSQVAVSPDCRQVAFHNGFEDRRRVYLQDVATGTRRVIASGPEDIGFPRFSRDGKWISLEVTHRPRGGDDIAVMPASGGQFEVILKSDQPSYAAGWMPDNDRVLFAGFRDAAWNVFAVSRTTRRVEQLTNYASMRTYVRYPDWLAGNRIVYEFNEPKGNIFVVTMK